MWISRSGREDITTWGIDGSEVRTGLVGGKRKAEGENIYMRGKVYGKLEGGEIQRLRRSQRVNIMSRAFN